MVRPHEALRCRSCRSKISAGTYFCNFACRKTRPRPTSADFVRTVKGCLAAYHQAEFLRRHRPRSSFPTRKVAEIGCERRHETEDERLVRSASALTRIFRRRCITKGLLEVTNVPKGQLRTQKEGYGQPETPTSCPAWQTTRASSFKKLKKTRTRLSRLCKNVGDLVNLIRKPL